MFGNISANKNIFGNIWPWVNHAISLVILGQYLPCQQFKENEDRNCQLRHDITSYISVQHFARVVVFLKKWPSMLK